MRPGQYTELFFLDEATALAAGHRPCWQCQRPRHVEFKQVWEKVFRDDNSLEQIDRELHSSRIDGSGSKCTYDADCSALPNGVLIRDPKSSRPLLVRNVSSTPGPHRVMAFEEFGQRVPSKF